MDTRTADFFRRDVPHLNQKRFNVLYTKMLGDFAEFVVCVATASVEE